MSMIYATCAITKWLNPCMISCVCSGKIHKCTVVEDEGSRGNRKFVAFIHLDTTLPIKVVGVTVDKREIPDRC